MGVEVSVGAVKVKFTAVCARTGFELAALVTAELEKKLNVGFAAGTALLERSRPALSPVLGTLLTDEPVLMDD